MAENLFSETNKPIFQGLHDQFEGYLKNAKVSSKEFIEKFINKHPKLFSELCSNMKKNSPIMIKLRREDAINVTDILTMEQLREGLQIAVDLELTVLYEYLFACFSIINSSDEVNVELSDNLGPYYSEVRRECKNQLIEICIQEMYHFRMASDMLISIGGLPNLRKVQFPSKFGSFNLHADLIRLNHESLTMFIKNEEPDSGDAIPLTQQQVINQYDLEDDFVYLSIAQLYTALGKGFQTIHDQIGDIMFKPKPTLRPLEFFYTTLNDCIDSITLIKEQGEGGRGGKLFKAVLEAFKDKIGKIVIPINGNYEFGLELQKELVNLSNTILAEIGDEDATISNLEKLILLYGRFVKLGFPKVPFNDPKILPNLYIDPSHWGRFLLMFLNYGTLYVEKFGINNFIHDNKFSQIYSRPSHPRPFKDTKYKKETQIIVNIANLAFQLLIKLLEALFIVIPNELNSKYKIQERYNHVKYYPIMTILLYPLGELVSYFQLSDISPEYTAGLPFSINDDNKIFTPIDKFQDITLTIAAIYKASEDFHKEVIDKLGTLVGQWIENEGNRLKVVEHVKILIEDVRQSIEIIYKGFTNSLPPRTEAIPYLPPSKDVSITSDDANRFYINIEFSGYALFMQPTDPDPTFEPRGFSGNMFMYEETGDPNFTRLIHTQNDIFSEGKTFTREFIPPQKYKGVKITEAKLIIPDYKVTDLSENETIQKINKTLTDQLVNKDFSFKELVQNEKTFYTTFPQINYALTNQLGMDPINILVKSECLNLGRAHLFVDPKTKEIDPSITYFDACLIYSNNFDPYPFIMNDRLPASGGYVAWMDQYSTDSGAIINTNQINTKSGTGQNKRDYYAALTYRQNQMRVEIDKILVKYDSDQYPFASQIKNVLGVYPSKFILLALMFEIPATDRNRLSYLCSRFVQVGKMLYYIKEKGNYIANLAQYFYHIPLNGEGDFILADINRKDFKDLAPMKIVTDETWSLDFWVGGIDYDSVAFFMNGNLNVPVTIDL